MYIKEKLTIKNFFSIDFLEWEPKEYNVITGEMGSGKSLCLKLLYFIYEIFNITFFENSSKIFSTIDVFYGTLERKFKDVFFMEVSAEQGEQKHSKIDYSIKSDDKVEKFDFVINIEKGSNAPFLFSKEIENITYGINNDYNNLDRLKNNISI